MRERGKGGAKQVFPRIHRESTYSLLTTVTSWVGLNWFTRHRKSASLQKFLSDFSLPNLLPPLKNHHPCLPRGTRLHTELHRSSISLLPLMYFLNTRHSVWVSVLVLSPPGSIDRWIEGAGPPRIDSRVGCDRTTLKCCQLKLQTYLLLSPASISSGNTTHTHRHMHAHTHIHTFFPLRHTLIPRDNTNYTVGEKTLLQFEQFPYLMVLS